jgi:predicted nucleic acid-binding protein
LTGYVIDASAMGPLIIADEANELIESLPEILSSDFALVPQHWHLEVANLGRMAIRRNRTTERLLADAFQMLSAFTVIRDSETDRMAWTKTLNLAAQYDLTAYDAAYLELAIRTGRTLVTHNNALKQVAARANVNILSK